MKKQDLRDIMRRAWRYFRTDMYTFSEALRKAWRHFKNLVFSSSWIKDKPVKPRYEPSDRKPLLVNFNDCKGQKSRKRCAYVRPAMNECLETYERRTTPTREKRDWFVAYRNVPAYQF